MHSLIVFYLGLFVCRQIGLPISLYCVPVINGCCSRKAF